MIYKNLSTSTSGKLMKQPRICFTTLFLHPKQLEAHIDVQRAGPRRGARQAPAAQAHEAVPEAGQTSALLELGTCGTRGTSGFKG